jgi:hypothetical protein
MAMKQLFVASALALILGLALARLDRPAHAATVFSPVWTCQWLESSPGEQPWTLLPAGGQVGGVIAIAIRNVPPEMRPDPYKTQQLCWIQGAYRQE